MKKKMNEHKEKTTRFKKGHKNELRWRGAKI